MIDEIGYDKDGNVESFEVGHTTILRHFDGHWRVYVDSPDNTIAIIKLEADGPIRASYEEEFIGRGYHSLINGLEAKIERLRAAQAADDAARAEFWNARIDAEMAAAAKSLEVEIPRDLITETRDE
jgi:hypothetical protein